MGDSVEHQRDGESPAGFGDALVVSVNGGAREYTGRKGPDPAQWGEDHANPPADPALSIHREGVKGPDPAQWAPDVVAQRLSDDCKEIVDGGVPGEPQQSTWQEYIDGPPAAAE